MSKESLGDFGALAGFEDLFEETAEEVKELLISDDRKLSSVKDIAEEMLAVDREINDIEALLKARKSYYKNLAERDLPEAMAMIGMEEFKLTDGSEVMLKNEVFASIPEELKAACFKWLRENDFGDLIKNEIKLSFGMGEDDKAKIIKEFLLSQADPISFDEKEAVHAGSLKAFVKEQDRKSKPVPDELFSVHRVTVASIVTPKIKKSRK